MNSLKVRVGEVSFEGGIVEYEVVAEKNVQARDLLIHHLGPDAGRKSIRLRDTPKLVTGPPRVIGKVVSDYRGN